MTQSFSEAVRTTIQDYQDGIRKRTSMFGTPGEVEAMWWTLLSFEALTLSPMPDAAKVEEAKRTAHDRVARAHKWPGALPLHANIGWGAGLVEVLDEWRTECLKILTEQR